MNNFKKISLALTVMGLGAASSFADVKLNDNLTINGFFDMSSTYNVAAKDALTGSFDQFEIDFMYKYGEHVSARADVNSLGGGPVGLEQAYLTYSASGTSVSAGKFLSMGGWEAAEPTGTFQYSYSDAFVYAGYSNGVNVAYSADMFALYGAVLTDVWNADGNLKTPGFEAQVALMPMKEVTAKVTYDLEDIADSAGDYNKQLVNAWASYTMGSLTAALEYDYLANWSAKDDNGNGWLAMANYKFTPKLLATVRYSGMKTSAMAKQNTEVTFSPCYYIADNWWILGEVNRQIDAKQTKYALESTLTF